MQPFGNAARQLAAFGLAVIPMGGDDGKMPAVRWQTWTKPPAGTFLERLIARHADANVGIVCGLSKVTVVDIDDAGLLAPMEVRFGNTPLATQTPRGGFHLWYRHAGEASGNLGREGLAVDIKARGGIVVVPPSIRPNGEHAGRTYRFIRGSWNDLPNLPRLKAGVLPGAERAPDAQATRRNDFMFRELLKQARGCDDAAALEDAAVGINGGFDVQLSDAEIAKIVASVWKIQSEGRNWSGQEGRIVVTVKQLPVLLQNLDALGLHHVLHAAHAADPRPFAISPAAMARAGVIPGWTSKRFAAARVWLVEQGFLTVTHRGGRGKGDAWQFLLADPAKGAETATNITKHQSPSFLTSSFNPGTSA